MMNPNMIPAETPAAMPEAKNKQEKPDIIAIGMELLKELRGVREDLLHLNVTASDIYEELPYNRADPCCVPEEVMPVLLGVMPSRGAGVSVLFEEECSRFLPGFQRTDAVVGIPGTDICISYDSSQSISCEGHTFLCGPMLFYVISLDGEITSMEMEDIRYVKALVKERMCMLSSPEKKLRAFRLD